MGITIFAAFLSTDQPQVGMSRDAIDEKAAIAKAAGCPGNGSNDCDRNRSASREERSPMIENAQ